MRFRIDTKIDCVLECNCSVCTKKGLLHLIVPAEEFELVTGEGELTTYTFGTHTARHTFCRHCGVQAFYTPRSHPNGVSINPRCLETGLDGLSVTPFDGRHWEENIDEIR